MIARASGRRSRGMTMCTPLVRRRSGRSIGISKRADHLVGPRAGGEHDRAAARPSTACPVSRSRTATPVIRPSARRSNRIDLGVRVAVGAERAAHRSRSRARAARRRSRSRSTRARRAAPRGAAAARARARPWRRGTSCASAARGTARASRRSTGRRSSSRARACAHRRSGSGTAAAARGEARPASGRGAR